VKYHQLPSLQDAGIRYYKTIVFDAVKKETTAALVALINQERNGTLVDKALIKSCIQLYETMGMGTLDAYVADFEVQMLESSREYYAQRVEAWMAQDSTPTYLLRVEKALEEERERVAAYLNTESEAKLLQVRLYMYI
jgi:cullin 1